MTELCKDGRSSNKKLAQKLGISVSAVSKKTSAMLQDGVIDIKAIPNPVKMGYLANAFIGLSIDPRKIDDICKQLMDNPHINLLLTCFGRFDILLLVYLREKEMLHGFLKEVLPQIQGIKHIETYFISEAKKLYEMHERISDTTKTDRVINLDKTDEKLILELMRNGRFKYADLAENLGISISNVFKRIDYLISDNFIKIVGILNPAKLGYSVAAFIGVRCELDKINNICTRLSSFSEIHMVVTLMNGFDIMFGIHSLSPDSLSQFLKTHIITIEGILHTETFIRGNFLYMNPDALFFQKQNP